MRNGILAMVMALVCASCSSKRSDACDPGETRPCTCGDLAGEQACEPGGGWGDCECSEEDAAADSPVDVAPETDDPAPEPVEDPAPELADDGTSDCDETPCGIIPNCGCPEGEKCSLHPETRLRHCVPAGTHAIADPCANDGECEAETLCARMYTYSDEEEAICFGYCRDEGDCPGDASICLHALSPETEVGYCTIGCDLLTSEPCPEGSKCKWLRTTSSVDYTDCIADVGTGTMGTSCSGENQCQRTYFCAGGTNCMGYCRISPEPDTCTYGCKQFSIGGTPLDLVFDGVTYGYCWP